MKKNYDKDVDPSHELNNLELLSDANIRSEEDMGSQGPEAPPELEAVGGETAETEGRVTPQAEDRERAKRETGEAFEEAEGARKAETGDLARREKDIRPAERGVREGENAEVEEPRRQRTKAGTIRIPTGKSFRLAQQEEKEHRNREVREAEDASEDAAPSAPARLEVDNPYWEKSPQVFEMLSGPPQGTNATGQGAYGAKAGVDQSFPVSIEPGIRDQEPPGPRPDSLSKHEYPCESDATLPVPLEKRMYIVMVTPEVAPCAKVGGLGDVILGLGRELMKRGHGVEVICPMYAGMRYDLISDLHEEYAELWSPHFNEWRAEKVFQGKVEGGLQVNFITGGNYTERENIYGYDDDLFRFTYFSRQALEFMYKTNRRPDIIHCHDWATGLVPSILWNTYQKLGWDNSRVVYTIHNNECQGLCGFGDKLLGLVGMDVKKYHTPDRMQDDVHRNCINMMKAGIVFSNFVTTVSMTYAGELKTVAGGRGLQNTIAKNSVKVGGILNGIDYDSWDPQTDFKLAERYSAGEDFYKKYQNKKALREWLGLYDAWKPIVSVVTRLTHQKGLDLIKAAIFQTLELQGQFVLLGSAPDPRVNADFLRLQHELKDNHDVSLYIGFHQDLSRIIYAGSDMFLVPSLYEPCGLTQMISLRYGTVPIVRETGGLVDTVFDVDNSGHGLNDANGFTFRDPNTISLKYGLERAINLWYGNPEAFNRLARNGMRYDYSWRNPAIHYENIYNYVKA